MAVLNIWQNLTYGMHGKCKLDCADTVLLGNKLEGRFGEHQSPRDPRKTGLVNIGSTGQSTLLHVCIDSVRTQVRYRMQAGMAWTAC